MTCPLPHLLLLSEGVTRHQAALRIDPDQVLLVGQALELFRRDPQVLIAQGQLAPDSITAFRELGECLYALDPDGELAELHQGLRLFRGHEPCFPESPLLFERRPLSEATGEVMLADLTVDRRQGTYDRDWRVFHQRKLRQSGDLLASFLTRAAEAAYGVAAAQELFPPVTAEQRERLFHAAARRVFEAPFELYSRFVGEKRLIKDGLATLRRLQAGDGGACSEKAQVMRLLADYLDIPAQYVLAGPQARGEIPTDALLELLDTFEMEHSTTIQAYWNHLALLVELSGQEVLVDASNGNIPFLWEKGPELSRMLDRRGARRRGIPHRYVVGQDLLYYHRVDQTLPERLLYALELGWADPHIDLVQVLDDELGLLTMPDLWLGVLAFRDENEQRELRSWYRSQWLDPGLVRDVIFATNLVSAEEELAQELRLRYPAAARAATEGRRYLEHRLEEANPGSGYHVEFVLVGRQLDEGRSWAVTT